MALPLLFKQIRRRNFYKLFTNLNKSFSKDIVEHGKGEKQQLKAFRHGYDKEVEGAVNRQILSELNASMTYLSISCYYGRTDIALPGCQGYFKILYVEEQHHAMDFINYQLLRGGTVIMYPLTVPENQEYTDITIAFGLALELEKRVKDQLECLFEIADKHQDMQLMEMVSSKYIKEQNESIWEMGRFLTRAKRLVDTGGVGRHLFDKEIFNLVQKKEKDVLAVPNYI